MKGKENKTLDEDYEYVDLCKKGDVNAFEILVRKYQKKMLNFAYRMVGNYWGQAKTPFLLRYGWLCVIISFLHISNTRLNSNMLLLN